MGATLIPPQFCEPPAVIVQRESALAKANRIRCARAALLRRLGDLSYGEGCLMAAEFISDPPEVMRSLALEGLLTRVHRVGDIEAGKILRAAGLSPLKPLGELVPVQRAALCALLRARANGLGHR